AGTATAKLTLEKSSDAAVANNATTSTTPGSDISPPVIASKGGNKTLAIAALGVGGAGIIFGGITGVLALGKHGDLSDKCKGGKCGSDLTSNVNSYHTMGMLSTVGFIVGGVGLAAGAVLWFTSPKERTASTGSTSTASNQPWSATKDLSWQPYV